MTRYPTGVPYTDYHRLGRPVKGASRTRALSATRCPQMLESDTGRPAATGGYQRWCARIVPEAASAHWLRETVHVARRQHRTWLVPTEGRDRHAPSRWNVLLRSRCHDADGPGGGGGDAALLHRSVRQRQQHLYAWAPQHGGGGCSARGGGGGAQLPADGGRVHRRWVRGG